MILRGLSNVVRRIEWLLCAVCGRDNEVVHTFVSRLITSQQELEKHEEYPNLCKMSVTGCVLTADTYVIRGRAQDPYAVHTTNGAQCKGPIQN
jgi:4-hydroxy-3-methylbut-2-en-1-yl diphosphate synthase IspG/GcpE